jgi:hypothetical protein
MVWVALVAGFGVALAKVVAAVVTSSPVMAAEATHSRRLRTDDVSVPELPSSNHPPGSLFLLTSVLSLFGTERT